MIYAQDGQNLFDSKTAFKGQDWQLGQTADRLIASGEMAPVIIVAPYNTGARMDEYTPARDDSEGAGGRADLYGRFLAEELKPWVDARLRTKTDAADTAILGSSLGGKPRLWLDIGGAEGERHVENTRELAALLISRGARASPTRSASCSRRRARPASSAPSCRRSALSRPLPRPRAWGAPPRRQA